MKSIIRLVISTLSVSALGAEPLKVGIYTRALGGKAMLKALGKQQGVRVASFKKMSTEELLKHDAVIIGAGSLDQPAQVKAIRIFVECGGGMVFNHSSCGRHKPSTMFPSVAQKVVDRREDTVLLVKSREHPIGAGLPQEFEHAYYDHLYLEPGPDGHVVVVDREDAAVLVAGQVGEGRVVFNGAIPGYWYDAATYWQGEREPTGGELQLVLNAVKWAGGQRLTAAPAEQVAKRRKKIEYDMRIEDLEKLLPTPDWFGNEMLLGSYLPSRPVTELGGRYFITYDAMSWRGYAMKKATTKEALKFFQDRLRIDVHQLKWLGVTDIMFWTDMSCERVWHPTGLPDSHKQYRSIDPLAELIEVATPAGMNVWAAWHTCARSEKFAKKYCAKDGEGKLYKYGGRDFVEDLLGTAWRERCHQMLDEYATKYKPMGNFKGLACYDELWFTYADFHGDDLAAMDEYCRERFGEKIPDDMGERLAKGRRWTDASDVWRRRYILFKQHTVTSFWRDLVDYAHSKGLQVGVELQGSANYSTGWCWGMDSVELARLGADFYQTGGDERAANSYRNTLRWAHCYSPWGLYNTHCLRGGPGGAYFTFNQLWRLVMYGNNLALPRELGRHIHIQRQWANAEPLARVAFLHHQETLQMLMADPRQRVNRDRALFRALQRSQDADSIFTRAHERYGQYRVLVAPPYSVRGLSQDLYGKLRAFVEAGGTIVSVDADWTVSRADLTEERDVTAEMAGVSYGEAPKPAPIKFTSGETEVALLPDTPRRAVEVLDGTRVLISFGDGSGPAVTERQLGKGRVVGLHFDAAAEIEKGDNANLIAYFTSLVRDASKPAVFAEGNGFHLVSAVRKGNWIAVALYPDQVPTEVKLHVDPAALGIEKDGFRMLMLGKRMEITRPDNMWGETGFWKAAELKDGFRVTIVADHDRVMPLPEKFDLSGFKGRKAKFHRDYVDRITRDWWDSESRGKRKRTYAHEIVVLAPGDEPVMPAE